MTEFWCMKCRKKTNAIDIEERKTSRGLKNLIGKCEICSTKVSKIIGK